MKSLFSLIAMLTIFTLPVFALPVGVVPGFEILGVQSIDRLGPVYMPVVPAVHIVPIMPTTLRKRVLLADIPTYIDIPNHPDREVAAKTLLSNTMDQGVHQFYTKPGYKST